MNTRKTTTFENALIWFGAAVSLAEILTGTYFAPLGFSKGLLSIIIGHLIGCTLLFLAGVIGGKMQKSSMETVKTSFGYKGSILFAVLNVIQLVGWTAIMIFDGAVAANGIWAAGQYIWAIIIGALIILWIVIGISNLGKLNTFAMSALFILTLIMSALVFRGSDTSPFFDEAMSFGAAVELSAAMPLSWLPLISDYTREAEKPVKASFVSALTYGLISTWMYVIGMVSAIFTGESDIAQIILKTGVGIVGLLIIIISTVTTTFLDAYSAGVSSEAISKKSNTKWIAIGTTVMGTIGAIFFPMTDITTFLYFIGSVFAPMIAIQLVDYFILKNHSCTVNFKWQNIWSWILGFIIYRNLMTVDIVLGNTLPSMIATAIICIAINKVFCKRREF